jgi:NAD(P)-dependent dehydrogenase (short-subunit alcohol dehydrogenase family)
VRTIVITGASDGIGVAAARRLSAAGHRVVLVGRSPEKTAAIGRELGQPHHVADFADLAQVRELAATLREAYPRIDVLANNAGGIMAGQREMTVDGNEKTLQINHLAPFLLTNLLLDGLLRTGATVVATSSVAARMLGHLDLADLDNARRYRPNKAYGDAKLANILFTRELHRRYPQLAPVAFHPGGIATNFAADSGSVMRVMYHTPLRRLLRGPDQGADQLVWFAQTPPGEQWQVGQYYARRTVAKTNPQADDAELARALWEESAVRVGL